MTLSGKAFALFGLLLAAGCTSKGMGNLFPPAGNNAIRIASEPSGADVYVMGEMIGVTPLDIKSGDVFPNIYPNEKLSVYGRVTLKKAGCQDFTRTVDAEISSFGLLAHLDCGGLNPASPVTSRPGSSSSTTSGAGSETVEQRLDKIKDLLSKGLITEDEAKKARERILNEL